MNSQQTQFDIARRGGKVEAVDGDQIVVSSGSTNHLLHFVLGLFTFGLWWVLVWLPIGLAGGEKRRVIYANTSESDRRLPHELPWSGFLIYLAIVAPFALMLMGVPFIFAVFIVMGVAVVVRAFANSK